MVQDIESEEFVFDIAVVVDEEPIVHEPTNALKLLDQTAAISCTKHGAVLVQVHSLP